MYLCRFSTSIHKSLKVYVLQLVTEQLGRHNMPADNVSRNLLKFLITSVGFPELRLLVAQKIDSWIQNPKVRMLRNVSCPVQIKLRGQ